MYLKLQEEERWLKQKKYRCGASGLGQRYYYLVILVLEFEEVLGVVVADVFDHLIYAIHFRCRNFSVLYITSYQITQCTAEVFVTWIRKE